MKMLGIEKVFVNTMGKGRANAARVKEALEICPVEPGIRVLEIGCGIGVVSAFLAEELGLDVTGTDFDPAQVMLAQRRQTEGERLRFEQADATALGYADGAFDLVVSQYVFHHIPEWRKAMAELGRVVKPGGLVVWDDIAVTRLGKALAGPFKGFITPFTHDDIEQAIFGEGFAPQAHSFSPGVLLQFHKMTLRKRVH